MSYLSSITKTLPSLRKSQWIFNYLLIDFLAVLGLRCCAGCSAALVSGGQSLVAALGRLVVERPHCCGVSTLLWSSRSRVCGLGRGSQALEPRLNSCGAPSSCFLTCGILPDQGLNLCLLHWQGDYLPLSQQGSPVWVYF